MNEQYELGQYLRNRYMEGQPYQLMHEFYDRYQVSSKFMSQYFVFVCFYYV